MRAISHLHGQEGILALRRQLLKVERENLLWHKETMDDSLGFWQSAREDFIAHL